jgi:DNA modification methylase
VGLRVTAGKEETRTKYPEGSLDPKRNVKGIKKKSLCLVPQRFALASLKMGWVIRSEIIWFKPNPMPENVDDRPTRCHEQIWMLTKKGKYFWDHKAMKVGDHVYTRKGTGRPLGGVIGHGRTDRESFAEDKTTVGANIRGVWKIPTEPAPEAHFATWPEELCKRLIAATTKVGDVVLDPFCGIGNTVVVAMRMGRKGIGMDLSWEYLSDFAKPKIILPYMKGKTRRATISKGFF